MKPLVIFTAVVFRQAHSLRMHAKDRQQAAGAGQAERPMGCKLVGTVKGTKLWAGDCVGLELRGATTTTERHPYLSERPK